MESVAINLIEIRKYEYRGMYVYSIFDFMGKMFLAKMAQQKEIDLPLDEDIKITKLEESGDLLLTSIFSHLDLRSDAIRNFEKAAFFTIVHKDLKLLKTIMGILGGTKINRLSMRFYFYYQGSSLCLKERKRTNSTEINYQGVLLNGSVGVDHLKAVGLSPENAQNIMEKLLREMVSVLSKRHEG